MVDILSGLQQRTTSGSRVAQTGSGARRLEIPTGPGERYRLAQLDDCHLKPRRALQWKAPLSMSLQVRASTETIPGTWGFGLWNDPFSMAILDGRDLIRLPTLPNTAWFFFASPPNYLSLDDDIPHKGSLAATFRAPKWPTLFLAFGLPFIPFLAVPSIARLVRRIGRRFIQQAGTDFSLVTTEWHSYRLEWRKDGASFFVDGALILETPVAPLGPLGIVLWVDNRYAAYPPDGRIRYGALKNPEAAWIEIKDLTVSPPSGNWV